MKIANNMGKAVFGCCKTFSGKGKYFHVFGCISKNFPENIFWCLEKKKENTNPEKHKPQPRKKSSTMKIGRAHV